MTTRECLGKVTIGFAENRFCDVVYFSDEVIFRKSDLKVRVGFKEHQDPIPVCYCFDYTRADIEREIEQFGKSAIPDKIKAEVQAGFCACEVKNPSGKCCLVYSGAYAGHPTRELFRPARGAVVKIAKARHGSRRGQFCVYQT